MPFVPYFDRIDLGAMWSEAEHMQDEDGASGGNKVVPQFGNHGKPWENVG